MVRSVVIIVLALLALAGAVYYYAYYPPSVMRRASQAALDGFSAAVATKDRAKIADALKTMLTDDAHIHLEVSFFSLAQLNGGKPEIEEFDKPSFMAFIDNTLYSLQDYSYNAEIKEFSLSPDRKSAHVVFTSNEWADGVSYYAGTAVNMRFTSGTTCEGNVVFEARRARLQNAACKLLLRSIPKPGEEKKLQSPEALKELLR